MFRRIADVFGLPRKHPFSILDYLIETRYLRVGYPIRKLNRLPGLRGTVRKTDQPLPNRYILTPGSLAKLNYQGTIEGSTILNKAVDPNLIEDINFIFLNRPVPIFNHRVYAFS